MRMKNDCIKNDCIKNDRIKSDRIKSDRIKTDSIKSITDPLWIFGMMFACGMPPHQKEGTRAGG
jgi:hypothetical protein